MYREEEHNRLSAEQIWSFRRKVSFFFSFKEDDDSGKGRTQRPRHANPNQNRQARPLRVAPTRIALVARLLPQLLRPAREDDAPASFGGEEDDGDGEDTGADHLNPLGKEEGQVSGKEGREQMAEGRRT